MGQSESSASLWKGDPTDAVVAVGEVAARRGSIAITGRYISCRPLEHDYTLEAKVVGSGMCGPVLLATGKLDGRMYAVKSFKKGGLSSRKRGELKSEAEIYLALDHPHVARLENIYETDADLHFVMEYMAGGELYDRLINRHHYTEEAAASTSRQMLLAVAYLHTHQIVHRDLKLENFLYTYDKEDSDHLKLIDFGFAKFWDRSAKMSQACGSLHYVAPEVVAHAYTEKADVWSLGVIVYMLLTGSPVFRGTDAEVLSKIREGKPEFGERFYNLSPLAREFVQALLVRDPGHRLSAREALDHPWISSHNRDSQTVLDIAILRSLRSYAHASHFRRAVLSMMAWSLSAEDRTELRKQFLLMDKENRGTITHQELRDVLVDGFHVDSAEAERLFSSIDADHDDEIEYSEFLAAALQSRVKVHEGVLRKTFARFDRDESGCITAENLRSVLGDSFEGIAMDELLSEADAKGTGRIDYDEFLAYFHKSDPEADRDVPIDQPWPVEKRSRKDEHTEKLGAVIDRLISDTNVDNDGNNLEQIPKPLSRRDIDGRGMANPVAVVGQ